MADARVGFVEHLSLTYVAQESVNLVTPKAGAKHERLFNKPASACLVNFLSRQPLNM
jgi:hypothetical protein